MSSFQDVATALQATLKALQMYTGAHPRSRSALDNLASMLGDWLQEKPSLHIATSAQKVFVDGNPIEAQSLHLAALQRQFAERQISGVVIQKGVPPEELQALLEVLILKPARIEEQGGVAAVLALRNLKFVSLSQTQYKAVQGGQGEEEEVDAAPSRVISQPPDDPSVWKEALEAALAGGPPADLSPMGQVALTLGWGEALPDALSLEGFRSALRSLPSEAQLSIAAGLPSAPQSPAGLRLALAETMGSLPGLQGNALHALLQRLEWGSLSLETRIQRIVEGGLFWDLSLDQRLALLKDLLDSGRKELFTRFLDLLLEALTMEDTARREISAQSLAGVAHWMGLPSFPREEEGPLIHGLTAHFGWEPLPHIHRSTTEALTAICTGLLSKGELASPLSLIGDLEAFCTFSEEAQDWRLSGIQQIKDHLSSRELMNLAIQSPGFWDPQQLIQVAVPYFEHLGDPGVDHLIERLGEEPDRRRRALLMNTIRAMGSKALPALERSLRAPAWYLVRNTLNLLADLGDAGLAQAVSTCMKHSDRRVRQAAVRATWKLAGPAAGAPLQAMLPETDPETQMEVIFGLGQIQAVGAIPAIGTLAADSRAPLALRVKATETLGMMAHPTATPLLAALIQRKGRIFTSTEPREIRLAAARALKATRTPEALEILAQVMADERRGEDRDALRAVIEA